MLSVQKLGWQLAGLAAIAGWTAVLSLLMFGSLRLMRVLRVSEEMERKGVWKCWGICNNSKNNQNNNNKTIKNNDKS